MLSNLSQDAQEEIQQLRTALTEAEHGREEACRQQETVSNKLQVELISRASLPCLCKHVLQNSKASGKSTVQSEHTMTVLKKAVTSSSHMYSCRKRRGNIPA